MPSRRRSPTPRHAQKQTKVFDPHAFLLNAGVGRTVNCYRPKQTVFSQGERADAVFYLQEGRVRLSVVSKQGKEATIALLGPGIFWAKDAWPRINPSAWPPLPQLRTAPS